MTNEDGTAWLVFNGEIYNYQELRAELEARARFRTQSDTEVLSRLTSEWGTACLDRFNGMFAFAIWDERDADAVCRARSLRREAALLRQGAGRRARIR